MSDTSLTNSTQLISDLIVTTTKLTNEVVLQKDKLIVSAKMAASQAKDAEAFAKKATDAAAKATQISGVDNVDAALAAREGALVGKSVEAATGTRIKQILDANGNYQTVFGFPCYTFDDIGQDGKLGTGVHPAFLKPNGEIIPVIWIGTYQASNQGGYPVSKSGSSPWSDISPKDAYDKCKALGAGWHLMTGLEWSAVLLWCIANGYQPRGNTEFGRSYDAKFDVCQRVDGKLPNDRSGVPRSITGSGSNSYRHNNSPLGISDLVGNLWEILDGFKIVNGVIHAASRNMQDESQWTNTGIRFTSTTDCEFAKVTLSSSSELLKQLIIEPTEYTKVARGIIGHSSAGEFIMSRGGSYDMTGKAGLAAASIIRSKEQVSGAVSFRPCYVGV